MNQSMGEVKTAAGIVFSDRYPPDHTERPHATLRWNDKTYHRLFVYGTLKSGERLNPNLSGSIYGGSARLQGYVMLHLGNFPAIVPAPESSTGWMIHGEIYDVEDQVLDNIDRIEGHPNFYTRTEVTLDAVGKAWTYIQDRSVLNEGHVYIPSGRWYMGTSAYKWTKDTKAGFPLTPGAYRSASQVQDHPRLSHAPAGPVSVEVDTKGIVEVKKEIKIQVGPGWEEG